MVKDSRINYRRVKKISNFNFHNNDAMNEEEKEAKAGTQQRNGYEDSAIESDMYVVYFNCWYRQTGRTEMIHKINHNTPEDTGMTVLSKIEDYDSREEEKYDQRNINWSTPEFSKSKASTRKRQLIDSIAQNEDTSSENPVFFRISKY